MSMPASQRRALRKIECAIRVSDPVLASKLGLFARLNRGEEMPLAEQLPAWAPLSPGSVPRWRSLRHHMLTLVVLLGFIFIVSSAIVTARSSAGGQCGRVTNSETSLRSSDSMSCQTAADTKAPALVSSGP